MRRQLRVWWPKQRHQVTPASCYVLFGWFISSSPASLDVVVALAVEEASLSQLSSRLEDILQKANRSLPVALQEKSMISMLGLCVAGLNSNASKVGRAVLYNSSAYIPEGTNVDSSLLRKRIGNCECYNLMEACGVAVENNMWIKLLHESPGKPARRELLVPEVHHVHWNGQVVSPCDVHVSDSL